VSTYTRRLPSVRLSPVAVSVLLVGAALVAWVVSTVRMRGMNAGPGTDLGGLSWFVGIWVTMMAAMMLPSVAPMVLVFARVSRERSRRGKAAFVPTWIFLAGYFAAWTVYGVLAFAFYRGIHGLDLGFLVWDAQGPLVAGGAIAAAGLYQLTPLKEVCLRHCRTPLQLVAFHWREGRLGAARMGAEHGVYCVGCCWGLMLVLFAVGVMSVPWMAAIAAIIFAEKVLPFGFRLLRPLALCFVVLGAVIAAAPGSAPF
jgi:predicted metal-binding membrane protein